MKKFIKAYKQYKGLNSMFGNYKFVWFKPLKKWMSFDETQLSLFKKEDLEVYI